MMGRQESIAFDGETFHGERDGKRLQAQLSAVRALMSDGKWHRLAEISEYARCSTASASARLRDLRKSRHGSHTVLREYEDSGVWRYRMILAEEHR